MNTHRCLKNFLYGHYRSHNECDTSDISRTCYPAICAGKSALIINNFIWKYLWHSWSCKVLYPGTIDVALLLCTFWWRVTERGSIILFSYFQEQLSKKRTIKSPSTLFFIPTSWSFVDKCKQTTSCMMPLKMIVETISGKIV